MSGWAPIIRDVTLIPGDNGIFDVTLDGELIYSKHATGRHANPGEVAAILRDRLGPELLDS